MVNSPKQGLLQTAGQKMSTTDPLNLLELIPCFACLDPGVMEWVVGCLREQSLAKGEVIMLEGEPCHGLFVMKSGSVKLYRTSSEGEEQIVRIIRHGGCFDCVPLFDKGPNPVSAQALEASKVYFLAASDFESLVNTHTEVVLQIVSILAMRLRSFLNMVEDFSFRRVSSRLAKLLLQLSEWQGNARVVSPSAPLNQQHLACMLGCSRQVVNSSLRKFVRDGIIRMKGHHIIVLKPEALKRISEP